MFSKRLNTPELMDDLNLASEDLRRNLNELVKFNDYLGAKTTLIDALDKIYSTGSFDSNQKLHIADLGCGAGDMLMAVQHWLQSKNLQANLLGMDANEFMIQYARENFAHPNIQYQISDIFSFDGQTESFDIITLNTVCHHFDDKTLIKLVNRLIPQTRIAIIINDLHRHWLSYFAIKCMMKVGDFSYLAKHDAPTSVLRAFKKSELIQLIHQSCDCYFEINWRWAFRWQAIIWKYPSHPL